MLTRTRLRTETIPLTDAERIRAEWISLARRAIEPNPFYEIDHFMAVARELTPKVTHFLVLVWAEADGGGGLAGLFPIRVKGLRQGFPARVTGLGFDSLIGFCVPPIADAEPQSVWAAFLDHVAQNEDFPGIVHIPEFYAGGACGAALDAAIEEDRARAMIEREFERAIACPGTSYDDYTARWSKKKARNIRSRGQKLGETGRTDFRIVTAADSAFDATLEEILALEAAGWKGRQKTALASRDNTLRFARSAYGSPDSAPEIHLATLRLDGRLIAGDINLVAHDRAYFIKSAYDEAYSALGPGVLLYAWQLEEMLDRGRYARLDSCADGGHSLEEIWLERETVCSLFVSAGSVNERELERVAAWHGRLSRIKSSVRRTLRAAGRHRP